MNNFETLSRNVAQQARRSNVGLLAGTNGYLIDAPVPEVVVLFRPDTDWATKVDDIEAPFAKDYDAEEYGANPSLRIMGFFELRGMLQTFGIPPKEQTNYNAHQLKDKNFLVVGTGPGREVLAIASLGANVDGLDATKAYLDVTAAKVQSTSSTLGRVLPVNLTQSPAELFQYEQGKYNGVTSLFGVLNHVQDWEETIGKISKSLKPDGRFVFSLYGQNDALVFKLMQDGKIPYQPAILQRRAPGGILLGDSEEVLPAQFPDSNTVIKVLEKSGLELEKRMGYLKTAALFPKDPTPENIEAFKRLLSEVDRNAARAINGYKMADEVLLAAALYDKRSDNQNGINDYAYVSYSAKKAA